MELALNLGWLVISAAVFGFFSRYLVAQGPERNLAVGLIALVCVICLLFPVVSMTDDLNSSPAMPEATKLKKLLPSVQLVIGLFSHALIHAPGEGVWSALVFKQEQKPSQQELLSFDLSRRPPPRALSL